MRLDHKPVEISLRQSRLLLLWIIIVHSAAAVVLVFLKLSFMVLAPLLMIILAGFCLSYAQWCRPVWITITCNKDGWALESVEGVQPVRLHWHYRFGEILIMGFCGERLGKVAIPLLPDSANAEQLRQLRQILLLVSPADSR